jgi:hypothetical protein
MTDIHEIWYERYAVGDRSQSRTFRFRTVGDNVVDTQNCEVAATITIDPETMYGNSYFRKYETFIMLTIFQNVKNSNTEAL